MSYLSRRARQIEECPNLLEKFFVKARNNRFDKIANPEGIINLGTSENKLMFDLLSEKFDEPSLSHSFIEEHTHYGPNPGMKSLREGLADFLNHYMKPAQEVDPENLVVLNGCGPVIETLGTIIADPGEGILIPAPFYGGFASDFGQRAGIISFPADLPIKPNEGERPFELSVIQLEKALQKAKQQGVTIRGLLLCNPNNPLGDVYSEETVRECMQFAARHSLHLISDEIYMLSIFKEGIHMKCALSFDDIPDRDRLHVVWGFSKDFGVSGFRCGLLHSWNRDVLNVAKSLSLYQTVSVPIQHLLLQLIKDKDWLDDVYIPTYHRRLREHHKVMCDSLRDSGIPFLDRESGLYVWANFGELMSSPTFSDESALFERFFDVGVYISPGQAFHCSEPGWFRLVFSIDPSELQLAMGRLSACIQDIRREIALGEAMTALQSE